MLFIFIVSTKQQHDLALLSLQRLQRVSTEILTRNIDSSYVKRIKVKQRIVLSEIHLRTTGRHLSIGSHSVICHPTELTAPPSPQPGRLVLDLSTP